MSYEELESVLVVTGDLLSTNVDDWKIKRAEVSEDGEMLSPLEDYKPAVTVILYSGLSVLDVSQFDVMFLVPPPGVDSSEFSSYTDALRKVRRGDFVGLQVVELSPPVVDAGGLFNVK